MITNKTIKILRKNGYKFLIILSCLLTLTFGWQANCLTNNFVANAGTLDSNYQLLADIGDSGLKNQIEGRAQQDIGKVQGAIDEAGDTLEKAANRAKGKADATGKQMKGRAQQDIGRTQEKMQEAGNAVQDKTENALDSVKGFFLDN